MADFQLSDDFPDADRDAWRALAEAGLRGADFGTLVSRTEDGLQRGPLFDLHSRPDSTAALDGEAPPRLDGRAWHVCAPVADDDLAFANAQLLEDLLGGASAVRIEQAGVSRRADLKRVLEGVHLDLVPVLFAPGSAASRFAPGTEELYGTPVHLGLDPLGERPSCPEGWRPFTIDAAAVHEAGGTDVQALGLFAATLAEGFRRHGAEFAQDASAQFALGPDAHLGAVKLRAARRLADGVAQAFDAPASLPFTAVSSARMMQGEDAWTNLLRTQSAGLGAAWGGADFVMLHPLTHAIGKPTAQGARMARNQQLLLLDESHLGRVRDPAHGSYFHERLTEDTAQAAWSLFQNIEAVGGVEGFRASGGLDAVITEAAERRDARGEPVLGVSLHAAPDVRAPEVRP